MIISWKVYHYMRYQQGFGQLAAVKHGALMVLWGPQHLSLLSGYPEV